MQRKNARAGGAGGVSNKNNVNGNTTRENVMVRNNSRVTFEEQGAEGLNLVPHSISGNAPKTPPAVSEAVSRAVTPQNPMEDFERYYDSLVDVAGSSLGSGSLAGDTHDEEKGDAAADWISTVTTESLRDGDLPVVSDGGVLEVD